MKPKHILSIIFILAFSAVHAQYTWSNPQPSGYINNKVIFTDSLTGYIINYNGDLLVTHDQGGSWQWQKNFPRCLAMDISDSVFVIAGADSAIYTSVDQAQTWRKTTVVHNSVIDQVQVVSRDTLFAVTQGPSATILYQSTDRGLTWQVINTTLAIRSMDFIDSKTGFATSYGGVYKTTDGGRNWQHVYTPTGGYSFITVKFFDRNNGLAFQDLGVMVKTTDGGLNWSVTGSGFYDNIYDIHYASAQIVFAGGGDGALYRSTDGGSTWQWQPANKFGDAYGIYSLYFINPNLGFAVGHRGRIQKTTTSGSSWQDYAPDYIDIKMLSFPNPTVGYAAAWNELFTTTDKGLHWNKLPLTITNPSRFEFLHFFSRDTGIVFSSSPFKGYKTIDAGLTWTPLQLPPLLFDNIMSGAFFNDSGYINLSGSGYTMLQTVNRGETWKVQSQDYQGGYQNLFFLNAKTGYGSIGPFLYKTNDSARTWTSITNNDIHRYNSIWFTSAANGYAMGDNGGNQRTTDSGKTWNRFGIWPGNLNFDDVFAIRFFNQKLGYLVSGYGGIYKTADGGLHWRAEQPAPWNCKNITMTADTMVYLAGTYGTILKKDMREFWVDSFSVQADTACDIFISTRITAVLSQVDSVVLEYGTSSYNRSYTALSTPFYDSIVSARVPVHSLSSDSTYQARLRIYYQGRSYLMDSVRYRPSGYARPGITKNGAVLYSSAPAGNQWYRNGVAIAGATAPTYQPSASGLYSVQQKLNNCSSPMSDVYNYVITAVTDPLLATAIQVFPNPVQSEVRIVNKRNKKIQLRLIDSYGRVVRQMETSKSGDVIHVSTLAPGVYTIMITEMQGHTISTGKLLKL